MVSDHRTRLTQQMAESVQRLLRRQEINERDLLAELVSGAVRLLPCVQHAGITVSTKEVVTTEVSTGPIPEELDQVQARYHMGPCLWAAKHEDIVRLDDVEYDPRWPAYSRYAAEHTPVRSVLSLSLATDRPGRSALNMYAEKPHAFDVGMVETAFAYSAYTAVAWALARRDVQFHEALASRDVIGQAKGMIMERFSIGSQQAFDLLKRLSQSSNTPLAEIAAGLVEAEHAGSNRPGDRASL
ncbi:GAF and ANTAR domain-containing protein [Candidatus Mycobacterium wuenschmannii]|uniref:GAF and ANTAR domain-containing protein n=1 Tax=Candidatus Mycobacterium wuenschmannii TaxID=3027808 RepID=A0ABY8VYL4_9MYCO|nr:GAF and ANTAR domain-containing protein [Candidatus Mycobacterium wuenschmannii]WIM88011.1 GAF and ANTAR domain-containing protein [Candidatus Mycobacterium wuenschmannii]